MCTCPPAGNRPASLQRLLRSLERADYGSGPAPMEVRFALDAAENQTMDAEIDSCVRGLQWPHGPVRVRRRHVRAGLRDNVLGAWTPTDEESPAPAVFLEDDVEVSTRWWHWVQASFHAYGAPLQKQARSPANCRRCESPPQCVFLVACSRCLVCLSSLQMT